MYSASISLRDSIRNLCKGDVDIEDFISQICNRIDSVEPHIQALIEEPNRRERLLREAKELKKKFPSAENRPPLFGIPVGVKDLFVVEGFETRAGSKLPASLFEGKESSVVTALKNAGALILGKTVSTEFAYFQPGPTRNPHNIEHTPGGSSSGSAAAVAAGFTPLALGTQTIGSISRPASYCGVYGFKPTWGRIPTDGVVPFSPSADHVGFFCQDLEGVEIACSLLVENWQNVYPESKPKPTIGIAKGSYLNQADRSTLLWFNDFVKKLHQEGFTTTEVDVFWDINTINSNHRVIIAHEFAKVHEEWFRDHKDLYRTHSKNLIFEGQSISQKALNDAFAFREGLRSRFAQATSANRIDIWISPSAQGVAPKGIDSTGSPIMNLPWTYLGVPTLSLPADNIPDNLPMGLQIAGKPGKDEELIDFCKIIAIDLSQKIG